VAGVTARTPTGFWATCAAEGGGATGLLPPHPAATTATATAAAFRDIFIASFLVVGPGVSLESGTE
jgi:hypothetical protein